MLTTRGRDAAAMSLRRWIVLALGALLLVLGAGAGLGGAVITLTYQVHRDHDGYLTTPAEPFESPGRAITSGAVDLDLEPDRRLPIPGDLGTLRVRVEAVDGRAVFVGIALADDVDRYLAGVGHDDVVDVDLDPFDATYRHVPGTDRPDRPDAEGFWAVSSSGAGRQDITWDVEPGEWRLVVMNADASAGVDVRADVGGTAGWVLPLGVGLLVGGIAAALLGIAVLVGGAVGAVPVSDAQPGAMPVHLRGRLDAPLSRWKWLVKWVAAIPHVVVLVPLWVAFVAVTIAAAGSVLVTGRYPRSLFDFNVGVLRWTWRVGFYAFSVIGTDRYPPFSLESDPSYPADLAIEHPGRLSRLGPLVKWLLALPHYLVLALLTGGIGLHWGGVVGVLVLVAGVVLLATGSYPRSLFDVLMGCSRWSLRVIAYAALLRDDYPPFRFDAGGGDDDEDVT